MKFNRTAVLGFLGVAVGLACSIYTAIKATPKAEQLKKEAEENKGEPLTKKEVLKVVGKEYIPTAVAALGCVASAGLSAREFAGKANALAAAASMATASLGDYKDEIRKILGEDTPLKNIVSKKYTDDIDIQDNEVLFYDDFSHQYFTSTREAVIQAEYDLNRVLALFGEASVNDWLGFLGLDPIEEGSVTGWSFMAYAEVQMCWVDFRHTLTKIDDDMECEIIEFANAPLVQI